MIEAWKWGTAHGTGSKPANLAAVILTVLIAAFALWAKPVASQEADTADETAILAPGQAVVTGFGGYLNDPIEGIQTDQTLDPDGPVLRAIDLTETGGLFDGGIFTPDPIGTITAGDIGQVFGLALDDEDAPSIYATATSAFGLRIVGSGDDARFADGQFGSTDGFGPGTIYKIDGVTGELSIFANVEREGVSNSGPGLGNIAFDPISDQLFVTDLDTGLIHRFDLDGNDLGQFDHGVTARPTTGLAPLAFDPENRLDLSSGDFSATDPRTWGFAATGRLVHGLAIQSGRLYYAASEGPQIWSVGIRTDGDFDEDPRLELDLPIEFANSTVTDIAFTADRRMVLAQRGNLFIGDAGFDFHVGGNAAVFAFAPESPDDPETPSRWIEQPQVLSVGLNEPHRQAAGGISVGHGYDADGAIDMGACGATLWASGDQLGTSGEESEFVIGLQGQPLTGLREEAGLPPEIATLDLKTIPGGVGGAGIMGDVEIFTRCESQLIAELPPYEAPVCGPDGDDPRCLPPIEVVEPSPDPDIINPPPPPGPDLEIVKIAQAERCDPGGPCRFTVQVANVGTEPYYGPISFEDHTPFNEQLLGFGPAGTWQCAEGDFITAFCRHEDVYLAPGDGVAVELTVEISEDWPETTFRNCAKLSFMPWQQYADTNPFNNESCDYAPICQPGVPGCGPDLQIAQITSGYCETEGVCRLTTRMTNVGAEDYTGPLAFSVSDVSPGFNLQNYADTTQWSCGPNGIESYRCFSAPVTLTPGEAREVSVTLALPDDYESDQALQCAAIDPVAGTEDAHLSNNEACATFQVCRGGDCPADLAAYSTPRRCNRDGLCYVGGIVSNIGGQVYGNPGDSLIVNVEAAEGSFNAGGPDIAGLCPQRTVNGPLLQCIHTLENGLLPRYLGIGNSSARAFASFDASEIPEEQTTVDFCVTTSDVDPEDDVDPSNNESCSQLLLCENGDCPGDFSTWISAPATCYRGMTCNIIGQAYGVGLTAGEEIGFTLGVTKIDGLPPSSLVRLEVFNAGETSLDGDCTVASDTDASCVRPLNAATSENPAWTMATPTEIPVDAPIGPREVCTELTAITGPNETEENDRHCRTIEIADPPIAAPASAGSSPETVAGSGLSVSKRLLGSCREAGAECVFRLGVTNNGDESFSGDVTVTDTMTPAGARFLRTTAPWTCSQAGSGPTSCRTSGITLTPGQNTLFDMRFEMASDVTGSVENCAELTGDSAPSNTGDAKSCVTFTLADVTAPPPPPEPEPEPEPVPEPEPEPTPERVRDLSLTPTEPNKSCRSGVVCNVSFMIRNLGEVTYEQALTVRHTIRPLTNGVRLSGLSGNQNGFVCSGGGSTGACVNPNERLTGGSSTLFGAIVTPRAQANGQPSSFELCGEIDWTGASLATTRDGIRQAQAKLNELGFNAGPVDGLKGRRTRAAVSAYQGANGLPVTGELDTATFGRLVGVSEAWNDQNPSNDRACSVVQVAPVAVPPPPPSCSIPGQVLTRNGNCVCPRGQQVIGGRCRTPVVQPQPCPVLGQFRNNRGICVCPVGTQPIRGACQARPQPCQFSGQFRNNQGICVCPAGQQVTSGVCRPRPTACTADRVLRNGRCVCPSGFIERNGRCIVQRSNPQRCRSNQVLIRGVCQCPSGTVWSPNKQRCATPTSVRPSPNPPSPGRGSCGGLNQRPCKVFERIPSCNRGLREDFRLGRCVR